MNPHGGVDPIGIENDDIAMHDVHGSQLQFGGHNDAQGAADQVHTDLGNAQALGNYAAANFLPPGNEYDQPRSRLGGFYDRVVALVNNGGNTRNTVKGIVLAVAVVAVSGAAATLIWYYAFGPGRPKKPMAVDDNLGDVDRGPNAVAVDVLTNDQDIENTTIEIVGADSQGVLQQTAGKWEVKDRTIEFTPSSTYDFNTPAKAQYFLAWIGIPSEAATVTITYKPATPVPAPDPVGSTRRADYVDTVKFSIGNANGSVEFVKPDPGTPSTQTTDEGVWTVVDSSTIQFQADANIMGNLAKTDIQIRYATQVSKPATLQVLYNQPVATDIFIQGLTGGCPSAAVDVVGRSQAIAPNTLDAASVKLVGLQDMELGPSPTSTDLSKDGKKLAAGGQGVWLVSDQGQITFVPDTGLTMASSYTPGFDRNNYDGYLGLQFTAAANHNVPSLGLRKGTGMTGIWTVYLTDKAGVVLTSASIDMTGGTVGTFYYGSSKCYTLVAGKSYYLLTEAAKAQPTQFWAEEDSVTLNPTVATTAYAAYGPSLTQMSLSKAGNMFVGVDFKIGGFLGNPTPATYTVTDNKKNVSNRALVILNYGPRIAPSDINDPDDTAFFANLRRTAFDANPALSFSVLLTTLIVTASMTAAMVPVQKASPISQSSLDARYTAYKTKGGTADDLWNSCSDINSALVDPTGKQSKFYARLWRLITMRELLAKLMAELGLN